jgi:hypothetical protein
MRKDMMDGTAIFVMTLGSGSRSIIFFLYSCLSVSAMCVAPPLVASAIVSYDTDCNRKFTFVKGGEKIHVIIRAASLRLQQFPGTQLAAESRLFL